MSDSMEKLIEEKEQLEETKRGLEQARADHEKALEEYAEQQAQAELRIQQLNDAIAILDGCTPPSLAVSTRKAQVQTKTPRKKAARKKTARKKSARKSTGKGSNRLSKAGREAIAKAAKKRWAKYRRENG